MPSGCREAGPQGAKKFGMSGIGTAVSPAPATRQGRNDFVNKNPLQALREGKFCGNAECAPGRCSVSLDPARETQAAHKTVTPETRCGFTANFVSDVG